MPWFRTTWQRTFVVERAPHMTAKEITDEFWEVGHSVTEGAVRALLRRAGVQAKRSDYHTKKPKPASTNGASQHYWSQREADDLEVLWSGGMSITECGKELGRTRGSVAGKLDRMDLLRCRA